MDGLNIMDMDGDGNERRIPAETGTGVVVGLERTFPLWVVFSKL